MDAYITSTGSFLPGPARENYEIADILGTLEHEGPIREKILRTNGIRRRHYATDSDQESTMDVYDLGVCAARACLTKASGIGIHQPTYIGAGTTYAPFSGPGIASTIHERISSAKTIEHAVEIQSFSGICSSSAQAIVAASRAIRSEDHTLALVIGTEHASRILKSSYIQLPETYDSNQTLRKTSWFMSVFLRSMLSDGAGAALIQNSPGEGPWALRVNWTHSRSFAHQTERCMTLETDSGRLSQDVDVLAKYMRPCIDEFLDSAMTTNKDSLDEYSWVLPHLSSFFFKRQLLSRLKGVSGEALPYWTNLETAGNTGAASIFIMLDEFMEERGYALNHGDRLLLFVPESSHFNFVLLSLTVIRP
ncbi:MAG: hypothetical protein MK080_11410 [Opitutales bacterium]|nr:hypothetical protein [Opitutales bacterium]NRA28235.1 hypothetical protein [Opitutales bacterium]